MRGHYMYDSLTSGVSFIRSLFTSNIYLLSPRFYATIYQLSHSRSMPLRIGPSAEQP